MTQFSDKVKNEAMEIGIIVMMVRDGCDTKDIAEALDINRIAAGNRITEITSIMESYFDNLD